MDVKPMNPPNFHFTKKNQPCSACDHFQDFYSECRKHKFDLYAYFQRHIPASMWDQYIHTQYFPFTCGDYDDSKSQKALKDKQAQLEDLLTPCCCRLNAAF